MVPDPFNDNKLFLMQTDKIPHPCGIFGWFINGVGFGKIEL